MLRSGVARGIQRWAPRLAVLTLAACDPGEVGLANVAGSAPPAPDTVYVRVSRPDGAPAADALVRYLRIDVWTYVWHEQRTDLSGLAPLAGLAAGSLYWVEGEQQDATPQVLGGGEKVRSPAAGGVELPLRLSPPRPGATVISEVYLQSPQPWEIGDRYYPYGQYLEVANNSDETIYLDGMLVGIGYTWWADASQWGHHACVDTEAMRNDSAGVWSTIMWRIPGGGTDHPLAPGAAAVLAFAAADHTRIHPSMLDLSDAEFEFGLKGAADNPAAANLELLGPHAPDEVAGASLSIIDALWFIAAPADVASFPKAFDPGFADRKVEYWRVPRELLLDVAFIWWDPTRSCCFPQGDPVPCHDPVHPDFDRLPGGFLSEFDLYLSAQRRSVMIDGRKRLLDTQTSAVDFIKAERTPGWLPQ
jgi:hypothetical protein